jgi:hypothetical protein
MYLSASSTFADSSSIGLGGGTSTGGGSFVRGNSAESASTIFSGKGFRLPLTTLPTLEPLEPGRIIREIGGLAFFNSRVVAVPVMMVVELAFAEAILGGMLSLALLLGSSPLVVLGCTGCPDAVRFRSVAAKERDELFKIVSERSAAGS